MPSNGIRTPTHISMVRTEVLDKDVNGKELLNYVGLHPETKYRFSTKHEKAYVMVVTCECEWETIFHVTGYAHLFVNKKHRNVVAHMSLWNKCKGCGVRLLWPNWRLKLQMTQKREAMRSMPEVDPDGGEYIGE